MGLARHLKDKALTLQQVDPAELSPDEFAATVRRAVNGAEGVRPSPQP